MYLTESITLQYGLLPGKLNSGTDSVQVTKETLRMHEQCVPGAPSDFLNEARKKHEVIMLCSYTHVHCSCGTLS